MKNKNLYKRLLELCCVQSS